MVPGAPGAPGAGWAPPPAALRLAERLVGRMLASDPELVAALAERVGCRVRVRARGLGAGLDLLPAPGGLVLAPAAPDAVPDVEIEGPPFTLARLVVEPGAPWPDTVRVRGDVGLARDLARLAGEAAIDWEAVLEPLVGTLAARPVRLALGEALALARRTIATVVDDGAEWLRYESGVAASREALEEHAREVEDLRDDVERLAARVARLEAGSGGAET